MTELAAIYVHRGLDPSLAKQVAEQLMAHDALAAHARDELGISETLSARPVQAAFASAGTFALGAAMPLLTVVLAPSGASDAFRRAERRSSSSRSWAVWPRSPVEQAPIAGALRVTFWGALAMALTAGVGALFGTVV